MLPDNTFVLGQLCFSLSFVISFLPTLVPLFLPLSLVLTPWFLGPGQGVRPLRSRSEDGEKGQQGGAKTDSKTTAAATSPLLSFPHLSCLPSLPGTSPSSAINQRGKSILVHVCLRVIKERDADCVSSSLSVYVYLCVC